MGLFHRGILAQIEPLLFSDYVRRPAHIRGIESFWALLWCSDHGTAHNFSKKHLRLCYKELAG